MKKTILVLTLIAAGILSAIGGAKTASTEAYSSENIVRLHVIANSDSEFDQKAKLKVRDAVLEAEGAKMQMLASANDAQTMIENDAERILNAANGALSALGANERARLSIGDYLFPDCVYGERTYPAGIYRALRVTIGEGAGHNWWCVMFPPLCIIDIDGKGAPLDPNKMDSLILELIKRIDGGKFYAWIEENWR